MSQETEILESTVEIWNGELSSATIDLDTWLHYEAEVDEMALALQATYEAWAESKLGWWSADARVGDFLKTFGSQLGMENDEHGCWNGYTGNSDNDFSSDFSFEIWYMADENEYYVFLQRGMYTYADVEVYRVIDPDYFYEWQIKFDCGECRGNGWESMWEYTRDLEKRLENPPKVESIETYWREGLPGKEAIWEQIEYLENLLSHQIEVEVDGEWEAYDDEKHERDIPVSEIRFRCPDCGGMSVHAWSQTGI